MSENLKEITDKDLIVFLVANGIKIEDIKADKKANRSLVYFEDTKELQDSIIKFANRSGEINIADYIATERRIKTLFCVQKN